MGKKGEICVLFVAQPQLKSDFSLTSKIKTSFRSVKVEQDRKWKDLSRKLLLIYRLVQDYFP